MDINSFILGYVKGKASGGGGSSDDVRYVTFMNGAEDLYVKPVATGDDCVDVLAKGWIDTPAKESTVDKVFTFAGWALTDGAAANANALKAVDEDRTVYAAYTSTARTYTITYYDSDGVTVLKTETLAYGTTPSYVPSKEGASFTGWSPALATVTGDASYKASWAELVTFAGGSWADIARISEAGKAADYFKIGDTRQETFMKSDGTTETIKLMLVGFNHDDLSDGSGKAGISVLCVGVPSTKEKWASTYNYNTYKMVYTETYAKTVASVKDKLPQALQAVMKEVIKKVDAEFNMGTSPTLRDYNCFVWAPALSELGYTGDSKYFSALGNKYEGVSAGMALYVGMTSTKASCWTRTHARQGVLNVYKVYNYGGSYTFTIEMLQSQNSIDTKTNHVCFGFCI